MANYKDFFYSNNFPYEFIKRPSQRGKLLNFHHKLEEENFDVVFELNIIPETPLALNPVEIPDKGKSPQYNGEEISGYFKRWLMVNNKLVISAFTIKGMFENAYANFFGGCYRVMDGIDPHPEKWGSGKYPYQGRYKRYRVNRSNSHPAIIKDISSNIDGSKTITIQPVIEFYYDKKELPFKLKRGEEVFCKVKKVKFKKIITQIYRENKGLNFNEQIEKVKYFDEYKFGMDLKYKGGDLGKRHYFRFYKEIDKEITIKVSSLYFKSLNELKKIIYMGFSKKDNMQWYNDLRNLQKGDWIYFNKIGRNIVGIGKNYLFKAIFDHIEAVPENQRPCRDFENLCPRCSLFGFTYNEEGLKNAYKGRFYCSNYINNLELNEINKNFIDKNSKIKCKISVWIDNNKNEISKQFLLPILAPPKPNKRDVLGYFNEDGYIRGAKIYKCSRITYSKLEDLINFYTKKIKINKKIYEYSHSLRSFAQVIKEGLDFSGTVSLENATKKEVENILMLIRYFKFRIGLGKSLGLGRVQCKVKKIWIRTSDNYNKWKVYTDLDSFIKENNFVENKKAIKNIKKYNEIYEKLEFPEVKNYWKNFISSLQGIKKA